MNFARALAAVADGDRDAAWNFIRDYAGWCGTPISDADGIPGVTGLPAALAEAYALFGRRDDLTRTQDRLLAPDDLRVDGDFVVFREENQVVCEWAFRRETGEDDPAVYIRTHTADPADRVWLPFVDRLSHALVEMVLAETLLAEDDECAAMGELADGGADQVRDAFEALRFPTYAEDTATWHHADDVILRLDGDSHALVRAADRETLDAAIERVDGEWTYLDEL